MNTSYPVNYADMFKVVSVIEMIRRNGFEYFTLNFFLDRTIAAKCLMRLYRAGYIAPCCLKPGYWSLTDNIIPSIKSGKGLDSHQEVLSNDALAIQQ